MKVLRVPYLIALGSFSSNAQIPRSERDFVIPTICIPSPFASTGIQISPSKLLDPITNHTEYNCNHNTRRTLADIIARTIEGKYASTNYRNLQFNTYNGIGTLKISSELERSEDSPFATYASIIQNQWKVQVSIVSYQKGVSEEQTSVSGKFKTSIKSSQLSKFPRRILPEEWVGLDANKYLLLSFIGPVKVRVEHYEVYFGDEDEIFLGVSILKKLSFSMRRELQSDHIMHEVTFKTSQRFHRYSRSLYSDDSYAKLNATMNE